MELWIRSQNRKSLIKTTIVKYDRDYSNKAIIQGATDEDNWYTELGKYKNKERALEVLDEIQQFINNEGCHFINHDVQSISLNTYKVYEMPEE